MPGKIRSKAQAKYLAIHNKPILHELSGGHIPNFKSLPDHVGGGVKPSRIKIKVRVPKMGSKY
jgi:hypothetical protein